MYTVHVHREDEVCFSIDETLRTTINAVIDALSIGIQAVQM